MQAVRALILCGFVAMANPGPASAADGAPEAAGQNARAAEVPFEASARTHWAFQPIKQVEPPEVRNTRWLKTPVDRFILTALEAKEIPAAPPATKEELIRRVTFDLIGLPPTLSEIDAFAKDSSPDAYANLIDRLLASPHYGERWGRHWLDVARFAETDGFEHDAVRPHAWRYRDYVVQSFNADKPYDRFIKEQLAGDELYPDEPEALIATAFNLLGPDMVDSADQIQRRLNRLNDMTDTAASAFLGLTMGCARCHDHKFEPLSQKDYYRFQAFFTPAAFRDDLPAPHREELAAHQAALGQYNKLTEREQKEMADLEAPYRRKIFEQKLAKLSPEAQAAHNAPAAERTTEQINQIQETAALVEVTEKETLNAMSKEDRARHKLAKDELAKYPKPAPLPMTMALQKPKGKLAKTFVLPRGDYNRPGDEVQPGFPVVLKGQMSNFKLQIGNSIARQAGGSQRVALAEWIASPDNPLTARVIVNRVWQHHFGRGLVPTPSDFGLKGERPSHPELLDWLADEFMAQGWSVKTAHKLLLLSAAYQQSSRATQQALARDPDNRLYSRWQRQRLEGEVIRDSLLAISGKLNRQMGGPGVFPAIPEDVFKGSRGWTVSKTAEERNRRSIYIFARRNLRFPFLEVFDAPDSNLTCPERPRSTSAPQSLTLLNADEVLAASQATSARLLNEASTTEARVTLAYRLILGRHPSEKEAALSAAFLERAPVSELCRGLFNLNAFVYVD